MGLWSVFYLLSPVVDGGIIHISPLLVFSPLFFTCPNSTVMDEGSGAASDF